MTSALMDHVAALMREAAAAAILPRFQKLRASEHAEKSPGEVVSIADREAERIIESGLAGLRPGSRIVGEEAAAANPALLNALDEGEVWLVDPLDGTANFIAGTPDFAVMVALLRQGHTVAAWLLHPLSGRMTIAAQGAGAFIDGVRLRAEPPPPDARSTRGSVLTRFLPEPMRDRIAANTSRFAAITPGAKCAGIDYPDVVTGRQDFVLFWRLLPWDHAAGALVVTEAGGHVARLDGTAYAPSDPRPGLLAASSAETWHRVRATLLEA
jgi:fructose-1,6-bisphosphatase/inositol monophosphatase family enzyme